MDDDFEYNLTVEQWEALKAIRGYESARSALHRPALRDLIALQLAELRDDLPAITSRGRKVLVRGSARWMDLVA